MAKFCRNCGTELPDGARFCEACGTKVPEEKPEKSFCTSCGNELAPDAAFCPFCGAKKNARPVQPLRETPSNPPSVSERQVPAEKDVPDYMRRGYNQRIRAERDAVRNAAKPKKKGRGLSVFLALVFLAEFVTAAYKYPGFMNRIKTVTASD
ncbi:MAG: zinc-ribbon domain-containing protein, partial [Clostridia bacterium]|nr:zinc-ribbon domain-containing protein [Clostridia bacterium]